MRLTESPKSKTLTSVADKFSNLYNFNATKLSFMKKVEANYLFQLSSCLNILFKMPEFNFKQFGTFS